MTDKAATVADDRALRLKQAQAAARANRFDEADRICVELLSDYPDYAPAYGLRGSIIASLGNLKVGARMLEEAVAARPMNPGLRSALADVYRISCRLDEALALAEPVARAHPRDVGFLGRLANVYADRGEFDEALAVYMAILAITPEEPSAHFGISQVLLARGECRAGWIEYEWRNQLAQAARTIPPVNGPAWNGMRMPSSRLLVICDEGFGDMLQFARYLPDVAKRCLEVVVVGGVEVSELLQGVEGVSKFYERWADVPKFAAYCLLSSLPYIFGTELDTIPAPVPYLWPDRDKVVTWRERLAGLPAGRRRVGLAWSGRPQHSNNPRRSMSLADLRPLTSVEGIELVSLQKVVPEPDRAAMAADWRSMVEFSADLTDFSETAALIANLDLVIAVDTSVGHLAGALGAPTWLMLANPPDWRWLLAPRDDSPWYPTVRLFRQPQPGDWGDVVARIRGELEAAADLRKWEH